MPKNVVFCWSDISGYMATCWRSLQQCHDITLKIIAFQARTETAFADELMYGIHSHLLNLEERNNYQLIKQLVLAENPDILVLCGWLHAPYRKLTYDTDLHHIRFVMGMDTPWQGSWKQYLASWIFRSYLRRMDRVVVPGERSYYYAKHLGIAPNAIMRGLYGIDFSAWTSLYSARARSKNHWPCSFLFVGRYLPIKAIDVLVEAYQKYRKQVDNPWKLVCCGQGEMESLLVDQPGIHNLGFVQPQALKNIWRDAGAFLLPSRFDPWPLALVEAAASGLPIICTNACGSSVEVVRPLYNGLIIDDDNVSALTNALLTLHRHHSDLPLWGKRSQQLAAPYAAEIWTKRWTTLFQELLE